MASFVYPLALAKIAQGGSIDWVNDTTIKFMLLNSHTPSTAHEFVSSIVADEFTGTGYAGGHNGAGRKALSSKTRTLVGNALVYDAADPSAWTGLNTDTIAYVAAFKQGASDATSELICLLDPADLTTNGGDVNLTIPSDGVFKITAG